MCIPVELKLKVIDRRGGAGHEAGHYGIGRRAGVRDIRAWIAHVGGNIRTPSWIGQTVFRPSEFDRVSRVRQLRIGVAGAFAEEVWRRKFNQDRIDVYDCLSMDDFMSPTDWDLCGASPNELSPKLVRAAAQVVDLLTGELRSEWLWASRMLMRDGVLISPNASNESADMVMVARQRAMTNAALLVAPAA
jgi:hypothetical protein